MPYGLSRKILDGQTFTGYSESYRCTTPKRTIQVIGATSSGTGSAQVKIQGTLDDSDNDGNSTSGQNYVDIATIDLDLTTTSNGEGFAMDTVWLFIRARVVSISGTGANVSVFIGTEQ